MAEGWDGSGVSGAQACHRPFTLGDSLSDAYKGDAEVGFATPLKKLHGIAGIFPNYIQIVASADAGIKTLADLKGSRASAFPWAHRSQAPSSTRARC